MKKMTSLRLDSEIMNKIKVIAEVDHRSVTGQIEYILLEYIRAREVAQQK